MKIRMGSIRGSSLIKAVGFSGAASDDATLRIQFDDATLDFPGSILDLQGAGSQQRPSAFLSAEHLRRVFLRKTLNLHGELAIPIGDRDSR
jgi:hypothetical protein